MQPARGAVHIREVSAVTSLHRFRGGTGRRTEKKKTGKDNAFISTLSREPSLQGMPHRSDYNCHFGFPFSPLAAAFSGIYCAVI